MPQQEHDPSEGAGQPRDTGDGNPTGRPQHAPEAPSPQERPRSKLAAIPTELRSHRQWVAYGLRPSQRRPGKTDKIPVNPHTLRPASAADPATWATLRQAVQAARRGRLAGVGFVFCADDPYCGVDLDDCIAEDGSIAPWAQVWVDHLATYTERSQSGKGLHLIARAALPPGGNRRGQVEMYDTGRFFVMTGDTLPGREQIHDRQPEIDAMHRSIFAAPRSPALPATQNRLSAGASGTTRARSETPSRPDSREHGRAAESPGRRLVEDAALIARAAGARDGDKFAALWRGDTTGYASASEADMALVSRLAFWTAGDAASVDRLFRQSGLFRP